MIKQRQPPRPYYHKNPRYLPPRPVLTPDQKLDFALRVLSEANLELLRPMREWDTEFVLEMVDNIIPPSHANTVKWAMPLISKHNLATRIKHCAHPNCGSWFLEYTPGSKSYCGLAVCGEPPALPIISHKLVIAARDNPITRHPKGTVGTWPAPKGK